VRVEVTGEPLGEIGADLEAWGLVEEDELPDDLRSVAGAEDVRATFRKLTLLRPSDDRRVLAVGLGKREELGPERLRVAAALSVAEAGRYDARALGWAIPEGSHGSASGDLAAALVEGVVLASFRFDRFKSRDPDDPPPTKIDRLVITAAGHTEETARPVDVARIAAEAANRARELQALPSNVVTPTYLADRAREIAAGHDAVTADVMGRAEIEALGMGGLAAVAKGSAEEPCLIVLRYEPPDAAGETLGLVGKAVTFDTGGISIKPAAKMEEMKMDMSGGAAVLEALDAIAELGLPIRIVACVPATENMPDGSATKPGDIITQLNGKTVEVNNTDAEGRLILADALTYCVRDLGADRVVDIATLTGGVVVALGSTYAGLVSNDDDWAERVRSAAERTGELAWRLPLHPEYKDLTRGSDADLTNVSAKRKASAIYAASFLEEFVDDKPWAHLDIAGTAWDVGRGYVGNGPTGFGVRLFVELADRLVAPE
jgi:leucyl aminopeptidase